MKNRLAAIRDQLRSSYWFIPTVLAVLAVLLSILTIQLDETIDTRQGWVVGLIYVESPEGARAVLSTVSSSMITVAGVVFSLTMVVLSLSSQQYGPLVLGQFMRDRGSQFVLGIFTATFIYCLLSLRTIRGNEDSRFVPTISVLVGLGLAITSLAMLIYFIHHVSESIQSTSIIARISDHLLDNIDTVFPEEIGEEREIMVNIVPPDIEEQFNREGVEITAGKSGYLQRIDDETILRVAQEYDVILQLTLRPGQFLSNGDLLLRTLPPERIHNGLYNEVQKAFILGKSRTQTRDVEFLFMQLSAIALRALSPAINDPYTAMMCIDRLGQALRVLLNRETPARYRFDEENRLRVVASPLTFAELLGAAFDEIRRSAQNDIAVNLCLLHVLEGLARHTKRPDQLHTLENYARVVYEQSYSESTAGYDVDQLVQIYTRIQQVIHNRRERLT